MAFFKSVETADVIGAMGRSDRTAVFTFDLQSENAALWKKFFASLLEVMEHLQPTEPAPEPQPDE